MHIGQASLLKVRPTARKKRGAKPHPKKLTHVPGMDKQSLLAAKRASEQKKREADLLSDEEAAASFSHIKAMLRGEVPPPALEPRSTQAHMSLNDESSFDRIRRTISL